MALYTGDTLNGAFEIVELVGGLSSSEFIVASSTWKDGELILALALSSGDICILFIKNGLSTTKLIPWPLDENSKPVAFTFNQTQDWLLVARSDGAVCVIPIGGIFKNYNEDRIAALNLPTNDVTIFKPNGSRAKPTSILWWQPSNRSTAVAIIGTELGELCFVELLKGRDVGGTYINEPVRELFLCQDTALNTVYLLITGTGEKQWKLVLEQKNDRYVYPLENLTPEGDDACDGIGPLPASSSASSARQRLSNIKQLSMEKFMQLKQRLSEAKHSSRKKPSTETIGVDTRDIDDEPCIESNIIIPHITLPDMKEKMSTNEDIITSASSDLLHTNSPNITIGRNNKAPSAASDDAEPVVSSISTSPERIDSVICDVALKAMVVNDKILLVGNCKSNSSLMVYSTDLESTPLYVYKVPDDTERIILYDDLIYAFVNGDVPRVSILSTFFSTSSKIDGELDKRVQPVLEDILLPLDVEILSAFASPSLTCISDDGVALMTDSDSETDEELPTSTWPNACLILTRTSLYICQAKKCIENLFLDSLLRSPNSDFGHRLSVVFSIDCSLFEMAADAKLKERCFAAAMKLYKQSKCSHLKCSLKFAWAGLIPEFITYMNSLASGTGGPDLSLCLRRHLATLSVLAHLHQLSLPAGVRTQSQQQTTLRNLLMILRNNVFYDEILTLVIAASAWRWESLQYLVSNRGLLLEKLHALLSFKSSPVLCRSKNSESLKGTSDLYPTGENIIIKEKETGFLHCISDPELRSVLLLNPTYVRSHMSFVLSHLDSFDVATLRRLASLYDPSHNAIKPFILSTSYLLQPNVSLGQSNHRSSQGDNSFLIFGAEDPIGLDAISQMFLVILVKLNQRRGWKYHSQLLTFTLKQPEMKEPFYDSCIKRKFISCGCGHSVVINDGLIYSWGLDDFGALGHGPKSTTNPNILQGIDPIVASQLKELCSLENGPVLFDSNENAAALKDCLEPQKSEDGSSQPKAVSYLSNMKPYHVDCGKNFTLTITNYGVYGWGNNRYGQIGNGTTGRCSRPTLVNVLVDENVVHVACGHYHSLAVTEEGRLLTWGWGVHGQLGHGNVEDCLKPTLVRNLSKKRVLCASGGYAHSVALTEGGYVYAWGCGTYGQVGSGSISKTSVPIKVALPNSVSHLTTGYFHTVAVTTDHKVFIWGSNPSALRVQAQVQRRKRFGEQQQQQQQPLQVDSSVDAPLSNIVNSSVDSKSESVCLSPSPSGVAAPHLCSFDGVPSSHFKNGDNTNNCSTPESVSPVVSANTVPSCDPSECGHLLPKEVEMPHNYGAVKSIAVGNQHSLLLTTHGSLYAWGKNVCGQLGTGNRKESPTPTLILDDVYVTDIAAGADFSLAVDSHGQIWGWGSNYHSQLCKNSNEEKTQEERVYMLKSTKRILKMPHSIHSNVEIPRPIERFRIRTHATLGTFSTQYMHTSEDSKVDLKNFGILNGIDFGSLDSRPKETEERTAASEDEDDGRYGLVTLHSALRFLHQHYSPKNMTQMFENCEAHQALAALYVLEKEYSKAMHHQLCALLRHPRGEGDAGTDEVTKEENLGDLKHEIGNANTSNQVDEAVRIMDHFLRLQTEASQSGMRHVLQEGIGLWLTHSLPLPQLEQLLLNHLPKTVYPLALLLFGDENASSDSEITDPDKSCDSNLSDATAIILSRLSTKFCIDLCSSVISRLQSGDCTTEQLDAMSILTQIPEGNDQPSLVSNSSVGSSYESLMETLRKKNPNTVFLSPDDVASLKEKAEQNVGSEPSVKAPGADASLAEAVVDQKDAVLFTCGHHFTLRDFEDNVLPQLERTVTTVPGLLGKTARVLLDQYHSDQPQMACPHCVLAHLAIKLTKHNQAPS